MAEEATLYKLTVLGNGGVGKSSLVVRLVSDNFLAGHEATIEDSYNKLVMVDGDQYNLEIVDTAGQEEFRSMHDTWMRSSDGFLLVYSIADRTSFSQVDQFVTKLRRLKEGTLHIILVGNKCDLVDERQVSTEEGEQFARELSCGFFETSALSRLNCESCFFELIRDIRKADASKQNNNNKKKKNKKCNIL